MHERQYQSIDVRLEPNEWITVAKWLRYGNKRVMANDTWWLTRRGWSLLSAWKCRCDIAADAAVAGRTCCCLIAALLRGLRE